MASATTSETGSKRRRNLCSLFVLALALAFSLFLANHYSSRGSSLGERTVGFLKLGIYSLAELFESLTGIHDEYDIWYGLTSADSTMSNLGFLPLDENMKTVPEAPQKQLYLELFKFPEVIARLEHWNSTGGFNILELASGRGGGLSLIAHTLYPNHALGIERVMRAQDFASTHLGNRPKLEYKQGDVRALPLPDKSFQIIFSVEANGIFFRKTFSEIKRVLVDDGLFLSTTINPGERHWAFHTIISKEQKFELCGQREITKNVIAALDSQQEERRATIWTMLRNSYYLMTPFYTIFAEAMRVPGTWHYQNFAIDDNEMYLMYCMAKDATNRVAGKVAFVDTRTECPALLVH